MAEKSTQSGLREGIDTAGEELGERIVDDLPASPADVRSQLTASPAESVAESGEWPDSLFQEVLRSTPLSRYVDGDSFETDTNDQ